MTQGARASRQPARKDIRTVLMFGLTPVMGGVETFIYNVAAYSDPARVRFEFLVIGDEDPVYADELRRLCGKDCIHHVPNLRSKGLLGYRELSRFFRERGPRYDWMHLNTCSAAKVIYGYPFAKRYGFKVLAHSHNGSGLKAFFHMLFRPLLLHAADKLAACSDVAAEWLFGAAAAKGAVIIKNGIDVNRFAFSNDYRISVRCELGIPDDAFVIGHVGRFAEQKNHRFLIGAFSELRGRVPDAFLLLVGTGELMDEARELVERLGIKDSVVFAGLRDDTYRFYSAMDVFAMPSLYEGLPVVSAEACASGLRCVYSSTVSRQADLIGTAEFLTIEDGTGLWAQRLYELKSEVGDPAVRVSAGAAVTAAGYDIRTVARNVCRLYCDEES